MAASTPLPARPARLAIFSTACLGGIGVLAFSNGLLLAYFSRLGLSSGEVLALLALPALVQFLLVVPFGFLSDWFGKKRLGLAGLSCTALGLMLMTSLGSLPDPRWMAWGATGLFSLGSALLNSNWFALVDPLIPSQERGRFFGNLRLTWQTVGFLFALGASHFLGQSSELQVYQVLFGLIAFFGVARMGSYWKIPEVERSHPPSASFRKVITEVLALPGYLPFCAYCFLLMLFTGACPQLFGLLERNVLGFNDDQLVWVGSLLTVGSLAGFVLGGRAVDRFGTRYVFLLCHLAFGTILLLFLGRSLVPVPPLVWVGFLTLLFGVALAASGIAMTSEILSLIPKENKSLATGVWLTLHSGGAGLSGILSGQMLELGMLSPEWQLLEMPLSAYDTLLLLCGGMVLLLTVTLGLIPSMMRPSQAQWIPQGA